MPEFQLQQLVYLLILLVVIGFFGFSRYRGNMSKAVSHVGIWIAVFVGLFVIVRMFGF